MHLKFFYSSILFLFLASSLNAQFVFLGGEYSNPMNWLNEQMPTTNNATVTIRGGMLIDIDPGSVRMFSDGFDVFVAQTATVNLGSIDMSGGAVFTNIGIINSGSVRCDDNSSFINTGQIRRSESFSSGIVISIFDSASFSNLGVIEGKVTVQILGENATGFNNGRIRSNSNSIRFEGRRFTNNSVIEVTVFSVSGNATDPVTEIVNNGSMKLRLFDDRDNSSIDLVNNGLICVEEDIIVRGRLSKFTNSEGAFVVTLDGDLLLADMREEISVNEGAILISGRLRLFQGTVFENRISGFIRASNNSSEGIDIGGPNFGPVLNNFGEIVLCNNNLMSGSCSVVHQNGASTFNNFSSGQIWSDSDLLGSECSSNPVPTVNNMGGIINSSCTIAPIVVAPSIECPPNFIGENQLTGTLDESGNFETDGIIHSDQVIGNHTNGGFNVIYDSRESITLLENFELSEGVIFEATIDGCDE